MNDKPFYATTDENGALISYYLLFWFDNDEGKRYLVCREGKENKASRPALYVSIYNQKEQSFSQIETAKEWDLVKKAVNQYNASAPHIQEENHQENFDAFLKSLGNQTEILFLLTDLNHDFNGMSIRELKNNVADYLNENTPTEKEISDFHSFCEMNDEIPRWFNAYRFFILCQR